MRSAAELCERLRERSVDLALTAAAKQALVAEGYDPTYGARPLRRAIQRNVENALSRMMLRGEIKDGDTVILDASEDGLTFTTLEPVRVPAKM